MSDGPAWVTAIGTVGVAVVAAVSAVVSYRLYRGEKDHRDREAAASARRQANQITAWTQQTPQLLVISNDSDRPITNCLAVYRQLDASGTFKIYRYPYPMLPASQPEKVSGPANADAEPSGPSPVYLLFTDADGRRWLKDRKMKLHSLDEGKDAFTLVPELATWRAAQGGEPSALDEL